MNKIAVYSTSNVLQGNKAWNRFKSDCQLEFPEFGAWTNDFVSHFSNDKSQEYTHLFFLTFLEDIFPWSNLANLDLENANYKNFYNEIKTYFYPLVHLLSNFDKPVILTVCSGFLKSHSPVTSAQSHSIGEIISKCAFEFLENLRQTHNNLYIINLDQVFSSYSLDQCLDSRNFYAARCRLSMKGLDYCAEAINKVLHRIQTARSKVLLLDCDNTLWGGVVGEVGIEGIQLGQDGLGKAFQDFQYVIKSLINQGVVVAICSKNNLQDALAVFDSHPGSILKKQDFACMKINWEEKAKNILEISEELSLGLKSFVFWDDNPIERESLKEFVPDVVVVDPDPSVYNWPNQLFKLENFSQFKASKEDFKKAEQYKMRSKFQTEISSELDKTSYLKTIKMKPLLESIGPGSIDRASQLCLKTNQFNLRVNRYSKEKILSIQKTKGSFTKILSLKDKFGDHGQVGLIIATPLNNSGDYFLDTFLMSCRVIGRHLETWMLQECINFLREEKAVNLYGEFIQQDRNQLAKDFLPNHGFKLIDNDQFNKKFNTSLSSEGTSGQIFLLNLTSTQKMPNLECFDYE